MRILWILFQFYFTTCLWFCFIHDMPEEVCSGSCASKWVSCFSQWLRQAIKWFTNPLVDINSTWNPKFLFQNMVLLRQHEHHTKVQENCHLRMCILNKVKYLIWSRANVKILQPETLPSLTDHTLLASIHYTPEMIKTDYQGIIILISGDDQCQGNYI